MTKTKTRRRRVEYAEIEFGRYEHVDTALDELRSLRATIEDVRRLRILERRYDRLVAQGMDRSGTWDEVRRLRAIVDASLSLHPTDGH
jgi:hypothetical protein